MEQEALRDIDSSVKSTTLEPLTAISSQQNELTEQERQRIIASPPFLDFIEQKVPLMEKALGSKYDFMKDYAEFRHDERFDYSNAILSVFMELDARCERKHAALHIITVLVGNR